ncbi:hypothetical protein CTAYLR_010140 [Chrysophaeum taylorii]|uniref:SUMO-activating enzyme subunit n=1 Tax=Chrysophaeum taylorii TaxID=2483200 RepID=A0AAD7UB13_9STRA|nr:hypothetical protein CTAYLR_010140 [Chrysophaeum taylorii]
MGDRYSDGVSSLGPQTMETLRKAKILVVGAGGIGCEVLKNLVLLGCERIVTVDLDTIDVSNLNRQLLFRREHVGQAKAVVAREVVARLNPRACVEAHHANIKDSKFSVSWFGEFEVAANALDNVDARRHVNRMCLAAGVPLVEAGTTGYLGQVFVIKKGETACYECFPKPSRVAYPICTIRSTPDKPVHCVVWAKELFKLMFGGGGESMLYEDAAVEKSAYAGLAAEAAATRSPAIIARLLVALFETDVAKQIEAGTYKTAKTTPKPLVGLRVGTPPSRAASDWDRREWTVEECAGELSLSIQDARINEFDKDDPAAMSFVAAAANLRCANFGIERQTLYAAKGIAGNIIPAIATTNAVVAGLQVSEIVKVLTSQKPSYTYCLRDPTRKGYLLQPTALDEPQPGCYACRSGSVTVALNTETTKLETFVKKFVVGNLNFVKPALDLGESGIYDEEDDRLSENLGSSLSDLPAGGIKDGAIVKATDFSTDLDLTIVVKHLPDLDDQQYPEGFRILSDQQGPSEPKKRSLRSDDDDDVGKKAPEVEEEEDDVEILEEPPPTKKRPKDDDVVLLLEEPPPTKKPRL